MKIRIKYHDGIWSAYFNGMGYPVLFASKLPVLCDAIARSWPAIKRTPPVMIHHKIYSATP